LEKLMTFMNYKNKKSFRELYIHPLLQNELIRRTIPDNLNDPKQEYVITRKGRLFLGGFPTAWPGQAGTKKCLACREIPNYKSQNTNNAPV
jgi:hypothetical protein